MSRESAQLRNAIIRNAGSLADWQAVRDVCSQTGKAGEPIAPERAPFFGEYWVGPYQKLAPRWTYVAETDGKIVGYLTGCADTIHFHQRRRLTFVLPLAWEIILGQFRKTSDVKRFFRRSFLGERGPEEKFPRKIRKQLARDYPAHLHMNVLTEWRSSGVGQQLLDAFFEDLADGGVSGVHLYCGDSPLKFYAHNGFEKISSIDFRPKGASQDSPGIAVHALARKIAVPSPVSSPAAT